jgi:hypothetical protein
MKQIIKFLKWFFYIFWTKPAVEPPKATDDLQNWIVIEYHGQKINLNISRGELVKWNAMGRHDRRGMSERFKNLEKKKLIRFENINGRWTCIKNKDYGASKN